jgi:hypothetical protein
MLQQVLLVNHGKTPQHLVSIVNRSILREAAIGGYFPASRTERSGKLLSGKDFNVGGTFYLVPEQFFGTAMA